MNINLLIDGDFGTLLLADDTVRKFVPILVRVFVWVNKDSFIVLYDFLAFLNQLHNRNGN